MSFLENIFSLKNQVAVVTGGGSGIGLAIAKFLSSASASVVLVGRSLEKLKAGTASLKEAESNIGKIGYVGFDLYDFANYDLAQEKISAIFGPPSIIVNCAGLNPRKSVEEVNEEVWDDTIDLNLKAPFFFTKRFVPDMKTRGWGRVINIASLQSKRAFKNGLPYGAAKGGVAQLTRAMAEAWSKDAIICNAIAPGFFPTKLTEPIFNDDLVSKKLAEQTCVGRNGIMDDFAGLVVFLASPACSYVTGQTIYLDGGFTAK